MIAYLDSSVFIRVLTNQKNRMPEFKNIEKSVASKILKTECLRAFERLRINGDIEENDYITVVEEFYVALDSIEFIDVNDAVLNKAGGSFPIALGTLDAIHLSSALYWREKRELDLFFLTHDKLLGNGALASGFKVIGC